MKIEYFIQRVESGFNRWFLKEIALVAAMTVAHLGYSSEAEGQYQYSDEITDLSCSDVVCAESRVPILTVDSDATRGGVSSFEVIRDASGAMTALNFLDHEGTALTYTLSQLRQKPQLLKKIDHYEIILVSVEKDFSPTKGGHANMRFLQNGMTSTYKNFRMLLDVQGNDIVLRGESNLEDIESDRNSYDSVFNHIFLEKNSVFGKIVGINKVVPSVRKP